MKPQPDNISTCNLCGKEIKYGVWGWLHTDEINTLHVAMPAGGVVIGNEEDEDDNPPVGVVLPYHKAPSEEEDEPPAVCVVSNDMTPREAANQLRAMYDNDKIASLVLYLLDPTAPRLSDADVLRHRVAEDSRLLDWLETQFHHVEIPNQTGFNLITLMDALSEKRTLRDAIRERMSNATE